MFPEGLRAINRAGRAASTAPPALTTTRLERAMATPDYTKEEWRVIVRAPEYAVSNLGRVKRIVEDRRGRGVGHILRPGQGPGGYLHFGLSINGQIKTMKAHRLVCEAFHGPPPSPKHVAAHNDGSRDNNTATNVRWATAKENIADKRRHGTHVEGERHFRAKLTAAMVREIRSHRVRGSCNADAKRFGVSRSTISQVRSGAVWGHVK